MLGEAPHTPPHPPRGVEFRDTLKVGSSRVL
jgi:hypothetical protein